MIFISSNEKEEIEKLLKFVETHINQKQNDKAVKLLERIQEIDRTHFLVPFYWGVIQEKNSNINEALKCFEKSITRNPRFFLSWYNKGTMLCVLKRFEEAVASYERASEINPGYVGTWDQMGIALYYLDRYDDAIISYDKALKIDDKIAGIWINKGNSLRASQRNEEALKCYDQALQLEPESAAAWAGKATALTELSRYRDSESAFFTAISLDSKKDKVWNNFGVLYLKEGRVEGALDKFDRSISLNSDYSDAYNNKAIALERLDKLNDALFSIEKAIEISPKNPKYLINKSSILGNLHRYTDAIAACDEAIKADASLKEAWYNKRYFESVSQSKEEIITTPHSIFISYANPNMQIAYDIFDFFKENQIKCWVAPRCYDFVGAWSGQITRAIRVSKILFLPLTEYSNASDQVLKEVNLANRFKIPRFTFRLDEVKLCDELMYYLTDRQIYDARQGDLYDHLEKILPDIKTLIR